MYVLTGVIVERNEPEFDLKPHLYQKDMKENALEFLWKHTEPKIYLLPETKREQLRAFDKKVKELFVQTAFKVMDGSKCSMDDEEKDQKVSLIGGLTEQQYEEMKQEFDKFQEEYTSICDQLVNEYDSLKEHLLSLIKDHYSCDSWFYKNLLRDIPSKEEFGYSFNVKFEKLSYFSK